MIDLATGTPVLSRFVRDLRAQAPRECGDQRPFLENVEAEEIHAAHRAWAMRIVDEYRSVVAFSELLRLLAEAEAPFDVLCTVQRLIGDELRHTQMCTEVVTWFGGFESLDIDLAGMGLPRTNDHPGSRALEVIVRELVVAEHESVTVFRAWKNATTDPAVRRVFSILLQDEVRHAAAGRALAKRVSESLPRAKLEPFVSRWDQVVHDDTLWLREAYWNGAAGGPGRAFGASITQRDLVEVGYTAQ